MAGPHWLTYLLRLVSSHHMSDVALGIHITGPPTPPRCWIIIIPNSQMGKLGAQRSKITPLSGRAGIESHCGGVVAQSQLPPGGVQHLSLLADLAPWKGTLEISFFNQEVKLPEIAH